MKYHMLRMSSPRNSTCGSEYLRNLDWEGDIYLDESFGLFYFHVPGPWETYHRVRPRFEVVTATLHDGVLYWICETPLRR